ncbi:Beta-glucosidase cel3A [Hondaea fermentalgiana]|uniref:Probable beta-glucosidase G n=1 Tax=Hondaea fermentalgiana TaxID=2315210 RepID=A0A2R5GV81_9STRA|nr:Beta-glucosidase cel3A [Hondaea fermentalgiana]|eukprot:GBG34762.1 Beta-glucosidase cel3A [Hondaea fermentalgiana]
METWERRSKRLCHAKAALAFAAAFAVLWAGLNATLGAKGELELVDEQRENTKSRVDDDEAAARALWTTDDGELADISPATLAQFMTLEEKIRLVHGFALGCPYTGRTRGVSRLGIPELRENDGPQGFRGGPNGSSTAYPSALNMAATFSPELTRQWGREMAYEFAEKGANMLLGPGLNVMRVPRNGRNFEYLSGEDPRLGAALSAAAVRGIQSVPGMIATAKHFALNNQETNRFTVSAEVDDVTLHEVYLAPFEAAVRAGVLSIMCSYNLVHGVHACEQGSLLGKTLREDWGFDGFVVSDWLATHSVRASMDAGLDQEMPLGMHYGAKLERLAAKDPKVAAQLTNQVEHVLNAMKGAGLLPTINRLPCQIDVDVTTPARRRLAADLATAGMVLLRNENKTLPLRSSSGIRRITLIGSAADDVSVLAGGGSGHVDAGPHAVTARRGLADALAMNEAWASAELVYTSGTNVSEAVKTMEDGAKSAGASVAVVVIATSSTEGQDRASLEFDAPAQRLSSAVLDAALALGVPTILVAIAPGPVIMPMTSQASATLLSFMPGQAFGDALAQVLLGQAAPTGRLPITLPKRGAEIEFAPDEYPGDARALYKEGLMIGYRWFDQHKIDVAFPFGFGLTYTEFSFSNASARASHHGGWDLEVTLHNEGKVDAIEVVQVYLGQSDSACVTAASNVTRPLKKLAQFQRVHVRAQEHKLVTIHVSFADVAEWNGSGSWSLGTLTKCSHEWLWGASSRDIRARAPFSAMGATLPLVNTK